MSIVRQDAWTNDEDLILAEVVLRYIREGGTQLSAFEEVGERLSRTAAACGFRWNSAIRKKYESAIAIAKKQRKKLKKEKISQEVSEDSVEFSEEEIAAVKKPNEEKYQTEITMGDVISFLQKQQSNQESDSLIATENEKLKHEIDTLKRENEKLQYDLTSLESKFEAMNQDYQALIEIIERARKITVVNEEYTTNMKASMNGSVEPISK
ncbi:RsfA family transcriptional regulator [Anaerobacillus sp. MEB173]|uniref:RsfA family transcriptional regulator n=1 Tax=Anaerobacillus sp. MEB173 TaxID=3383345 RepID=UPI003F939F1D